MIEYMTSDRIANAISQDTRFDGYYVIVEGSKDIKIYERIFARRNIRVRPAFGNVPLREVLQLLSDRGFEKKTGIVDSDFNQILGIKETSPDIHVTDDHDIEVTILKTDALEKTVYFYCEQARIDAFLDDRENQIREIVFDLGKKIGHLKLANKMFSLGLVFKPEKPEGNKIKYKKFICEKKLDYLGDDLLIKTAIEYSTNRGTNLKSQDEIVQSLAEVAGGTYQLDQICNGHDLSEVLFLLIKKVLKSSNKSLVSPNSVEDALALQFAFSDFKKTKLFESLDTWASARGCKLF